MAHPDRQAGEIAEGSANSKYPALDPCARRLRLGERGLKESGEASIAIGLAKPFRYDPRVMLVGRQLNALIIAIPERRIGLGHHRSSGWNLPAIKWPEVEPSSELFPKIGQPGQAGVRRFGD